ncbi:MAG: ammonia-forming cytochrome c nitrite reductase subunit c552 [Candidatus Thorarchaeota archaeon]
MVYYTDETPGVNKRLVAGYYLFLCLIGFSILLGPTGSGIPITVIGNEVRDEHYVATPGLGTDPSDCNVCHPDKYGNWSGTEHATHMDTYNSTHVRIGAFAWVTWTMFNSTCSECHTSGWDNSTGTPTYDFLGVNCFACHTGDPVVDYSGDACAPCHLPSGEEHPHQMVPWQNSAHANSLTDLRTSSHAGSSCMHCMSTEGFIDQEGTYDPQGDFSPVSCPACHSVHSNWSAGEAMIRADSPSELCGSCHVGDRHTTYQTWVGGPHALAGVECIDCHGYDIAPGDNVFLNHTFVVDPDVACGQAEECHMGLESWAVDQLETYQTSYEDLTAEIEAEAAAFETTVLAYNATAGANYTLVDYVLGIADDATGMVEYYNGDGSEGFHHPHQIFGDLNAAYADLLDAKAYFYEMTGGTGGGPGLPANTLIIVGGAVGGIVVGLLLGVLVGRRR